jgi:glycosyltransferase involved in cell wall biosynthesis
VTAPRDPEFAIKRECELSVTRRIIFVNRFFFPDGSATSQLLGDLAFALRDDGHEVHVIPSRVSYTGGRSFLPKFERIRGVSVHRIWTFNLGRNHIPGRVLDYLSFYAVGAFELWRQISPGDTVVVMTDPPLFAVPAFLICKLRGARLVNWLQDVFPEVAVRLGLLSQSGLLTRALSRIQSTALRGARLNVAISAGMKHYLSGEGLADGSVEVIPNWSDRETVYPVPTDQNQLRQSWDLAGKFVVGHSGNLGRVHEIETIKQAIQSLAGDARFLFLFVGGGKGYEDLREWATERGLANVRFHPYQPRDQLHLSLSAPDVHLISLAPEMEGLVFPSKLYGILAAGRPAIFVGARKSEVAEVLKSAGCGTAVEAGHGDELAEAVLYLENNPDVRWDMGRRGRELFERDYDRSIAIERWRRILES